MEYSSNLPDGQNIMKLIVVNLIVIFFLKPIYIYILYIWYIYVLYILYVYYISNWITGFNADLYWIIRYVIIY